MPYSGSRDRKFIKYDFVTWKRHPGSFLVHAHYRLGYNGAPDTHDEVAEDFAEGLRLRAYSVAMMPISGCLIMMRELFDGECCITGTIVVAGYN